MSWSSYMLNINLSYDPLTPVLFIYPWKIKIYVTKYFYLYAYRYLIQTSQELETIWMSISWWINEDNGISLGNKKEYHADINLGNMVRNMVQLQKTPCYVNLSMGNVKNRQYTHAGGWAAVQDWSMGRQGKGMTVRGMSFSSRWSKCSKLQR